MTDLSKASLPGNQTVTCPKCSTKHSRGPVNGVDVYRCFNCGNAWKGTPVRELRRRPAENKRSSI